MRVAYLSASLIPSRTANSVHVMSMCGALARQGHDVTLYGRRGQEGDPFALYGAKGFQLRLFPQLRVPAVRALAYSAQVRRAVGRLSPDVIYARHLLSLVSLRNLGIPLVYEAHTPPPNLVQRQLENTLFRSPNFFRLVVISQALASWYQASVPILKTSHMLVAHDGANDAQCAARPTQKLAHRFSVGYVGQLYPGKGMEVISQLPALMPDVDFHVVGGTPSDLDFWRQQAKAPNIKFHGFVPHASLSDVMSTFDVVIAPYQRLVTGFGKTRDISSWMSPLKIFEYMSASVPMIVSDLPVLREVLQDRRNAMLVSPDDPQAWASAIRELRINGAQRIALATNARMDFLAHYSWDSRARTVLAGL